VFAYFESQGFYACDMNGALLWQTDLGDQTMRNEFGEGSTPVPGHPLLPDDQLRITRGHR
jgi:hypothetical protein